MSKGGRTLGERLPQGNAREKLTGSAQYTADLYLPGMLHGAILASPYPHARIKGYDLSAALAMPGVKAIVTGDDLNESWRFGVFVKDEYALAKGKVLYVGQPVAAVAADTEVQARAAAAAVHVTYEQIPALLTPEAALESEVRLHDKLEEYETVCDTGGHGNLCSRTDIREGDVDKGFRECDLVFEHRFETQAQAHVALEPCAALAQVDSGGRVTIWSPCQSVFRVQAFVSEALGLSMSRLRCLSPHVGGSFGLKFEAHIQPIVAALAMKSRRAVKLVLSREEDFEMVRARHPFSIRVKTGVRRDGTFVAREVEALVDGGAYADDSPSVLGVALFKARGPYRIPHVHFHGRVAYTNKLRFGAFRGFGNAQMTFATESHIDEIASALKMDPIELRLKNIMRSEDAWLGGGISGSNGLKQCIEEVRRASAWQQGGPKPASSSGKRGLGFALAAHQSGFLASSAIIRLLEDGTVVLNSSVPDLGQGSTTVLRQLCAEVLRIPIGNVTSAIPDTDGSSYDWGAGGSRLTFMAGRSVVEASQRVADRLKQHAAEILECSPADLELLEGGFVAVKGVPQRRTSYREISTRCHWHSGGPIIESHSWVYRHPAIDSRTTSAVGFPISDIGNYSFSAVVVDVEVDSVTGKTQVRSAWAACDVGRAINPMLVEGQIEGAFVQGMGYALLEEMVWDGARIANPTLMDYKIPTFKEAPDRIYPIIVESGDPDGPFGAKGVGEIGLVPVAAAIANAVRRAGAARIFHLPMTAERVLNAMHGAEDQD